MILRPTYATRRMIKTATDISITAEFDAQVDSALCAGADEVDSLCNRRFYNKLETASFDWPNFQRAYPWRIWLEQRELATVTAPVPTVTSGGKSIPASALLWGPWNYAPPYRKVEIDRSTSYSFGVGSTPQRDTMITGLFGYWTQSRSAGTLAAAMSDTTSPTCTVSDSSAIDAGDVVTIDTETMLVQDTAMADTGQAQSGLGCSTASSADNQLTVGNGAALHVNEVISLDAERMLITSITGNVATVMRAYDGSVLATHSNAEVFALRLLTITRGDFGSTAATHTNSTAITAAVAPGGVRTLAQAEALNIAYQTITAWARTIGENNRAVPGGSLPDLRAQTRRSFGRKGRTKVV